MMSLRTARTVSLVLFLTAVLLIQAAGLPAQVRPGEIRYFPTNNFRDGRMLSVGCLQALNQPISISLSVPPTEAAFVLAVFDGDSGVQDSLGRAHWDSGKDQLLYRLYFDPEGRRSQQPQDLVAQWTGNDANPLSSPPGDPDRQWTVSRSKMPDNAAWTAAVGTSGRALAPGGSHYSYHLVVLVDPAVTCSSSASDFKIGIGAPATLSMNFFSIEGSLRQIANDGPIIYPQFQLLPLDPRFFLETPTRYDGTFQFPIRVTAGQVELRLIDGDLDHGTSGLLAFPSLALLHPCGDEDDPDTPSDYSGFPSGFNPAGARPEGASGSGSPADDNILDIFRRGEPGDRDYRGCTRYEVLDPTGTVYRNDNPSGGREWEQFRIATRRALNPNDADYGPQVAADGQTFVTTDFLPAGTWTVRIVGLDLGNINYWSVRTTP